MRWDKLSKNDTVHLLIPEMVDDVFVYKYFVGSIYLINKEIEFGQDVITFGIKYGDEKLMFDLDEYDFSRQVITVFGGCTLKFVHRRQIGDIFIGFDKKSLQSEYESMLDDEIEILNIDIESMESRRNALKLLKEKEIF